MSKAGYPLWWETTITVFNKFEDAQTHVVRWYKTIVTDCFWQLSGNQVLVGAVELNSKSVLCRIPEDSRFLERYAWEQIPNDQMANYFTLGQGDIIVRGEVDDVIDEYVAGRRSSDLLAKYTRLQGCMQVDTITINIGAGRNNPHYLVRGL